ncbi:MAG: hypothetical protein MUO89_00285 [Dehalococcoidia bacterium]|nr:hypothetical protein [Dehalococcoidia bacterium]
MATVEISIITSGNIPWSFKRDIENIFRDCYRRFGSRIPYKVEIHVVDKEANMRALLKEDKLRLGMAASDGDEEFVCAHDAWRGYPRVICSLDKLAQLNKSGKLGAIRHEAAHSALHGSLEYYIFRIPDECRHTAAIKGLEPPVLDQALYYVSVAVKDYEATRLLVQHDFIDCQFTFALEWLKPSEQSKSDWKLAQANRQAKFIYLTTLLRPMLFAHPLLALPRSKNISLENQVQLARRVEEMLEHLGTTEQNRLLQVTSAIAEEATEDTHKNVDIAMCQVMNLA